MCGTANNELNALGTQYELDEHVGFRVSRVPTGKKLLTTMCIVTNNLPKSYSKVKDGAPVY